MNQILNDRSGIGGEGRVMNEEDVGGIDLETPVRDRSIVLTSQNEECERTT
jgi:hypothetical protein